jgi:TusE/DsrC/DsvC family sulfur relay protein
MSKKSVNDLEAPARDSEGFLQDPKQWSSALAERLAEQAGLGRLTEEHWRVIGHVRSHFLHNGTLPVMRLICEEIELEPHCINRLFGRDIKLLWHVAGLPNPGEEAKSYM